MPVRTSMPSSLSARVGAVLGAAALSAGALGLTAASAQAAPAPSAQAGPSATVAAQSDRSDARFPNIRTWERLAQCESGQRWRINTGNGYYGGLQFSASTWRGFGGGKFASYAHRATKPEQITIAKRVRQGQGWGAWPACSRKLGLGRG